MKIAILNTDVIDTIALLQAIDAQTLQDQTLKYVAETDSYYIFFTHATSGDYAAANQLDNKGFWLIDKSASTMFEVDDNYDFNANGATEVTTQLAATMLSESAAIYDKPYYFEDSTEYSNSFTAFEKVFDSRQFIVQEDAKFKFDVSVSCLNTNSKQGVNIYVYLDDDTSKQVFQIYGYANSANAYSVHSKWTVADIIAGTHIVSVYIASTKNNKTAKIKDFKLLITQL